jgi:hypothetical protein
MKKKKKRLGGDLTPKRLKYRKINQTEKKGYLIRYPFLFLFLSLFISENIASTKAKTKN